MCNSEARPENLACTWIPLFQRNTVPPYFWPILKTEEEKFFQNGGMQLQDYTVRTTGLICNLLGGTISSGMYVHMMNCSLFNSAF
jgi:hypothetical protein